MSARIFWLRLPALLFLLSVVSSSASAGEEAGAARPPCAPLTEGSSAQKPLRLPAASLLRPYVRPLRAMGGQPPYRFEFSDGDLEASGLVLSPDGRILGRPTRLGEWQFTVTARDVTGCQQASQRYRLRVVSPARPVWHLHEHRPRRPAGTATPAPRQAQAVPGLKSAERALGEPGPVLTEALVLGEPLCATSSG